jgi:hypothetical protein
MAFFNLIVKQERSPDDPEGIMESLRNLQTELTSSAHYTRQEDREKNIDKTIGLIQKYFVKKEPPVLHHGAGLAIDLVNSLRRSRIETSRYECKQGILRLDKSREWDKDLVHRIVETICGIANVGPESDGYIFVGVADKSKDADRIKELDKIDPIPIRDRYVVGVGREASILGVSLEDYVDKLLGKIRSSSLSDPLKRHVLTQVDIIDYKGYSVIRFKIPAQEEVSFVGQTAFLRDGSSTIKAKGRELLSIDKLFQKRRD